MNIFIIFTLFLTGIIFILIGFILVKLFIKKKLPESNYTPFDRLVGHTPIEFHEHKEKDEESDQQGDNKNKNIKKRLST